jgi:predicted RNase H-like HicB family nuclease
MTKAAKYRVVYERDAESPGWWLVTLDGIQGVFSDGRRLDEARRNIREALAAALDDDDAADRAVFDEEIVLPPGAKGLIAEQRAARVAARDEARRAADLETAAAAALTRDLGLSLRDAAELMGMSHVMVSKALARPTATGDASATARRMRTLDGKGRVSGATRDRR